LYELLSADAEGVEQKAADIWEEALDLYEHKKFREAFSLFASLIKRYPDDNVARVYAFRCKAFIKTPPPPDWDAVINLTKK
jgi:adenylate cyclase